MTTYSDAPRFRIKTRGSYSQPDVIICLRSDTIDQWQDANPTLLKGELAVAWCDDGPVVVIGDGESSFNELHRLTPEQAGGRLFNGLIDV